MSAFDLVALLLLAAAVIGFANERWIGLPPPICLLLGAIATSLAIMALDPLVPYDLSAVARDALQRIDFSAFLMDGVLAFLLFAAALHVRIDALRSTRWTILGLATAGVIISTALFGVLLWLALQVAGAAVPLAWCVVLGAMLAPTDAVVVEGLLRRVDLAPRLKAAITGESLFNDGAGVVVFLVTLETAQGTRGLIGYGIVAFRLLAESAGGVALGLATGIVARAALRRASPTVSLTISLALVLVTYRLAQVGGVSVALALSLPPGPYRSLLVTACYAVVVFSIVVQGLSMPAFIRRATGRTAAG